MKGRFRIKELVNQRADRVRFGKCGQLIAEFEVLDDVLDVGRKAVEVVFKIGEQLLLTAAGLQVTQSKLRGVVECLSGGVAQRCSLFRDARLVKHLLCIQHILFGRLQHGIHAPDHTHRKDHVWVFATFEEIAKNIISNAPDKRDDFVVRCLIHFRVRS